MNQVNLSPEQIARYRQCLLWGIGVAFVCAMVLASFGMKRLVGTAIYPNALATLISLGAGALAAYAINGFLEGQSKSLDFLDTLPHFTISQMTPSREFFGSLQSGQFLAVDERARKLAVLRKVQGQPRGRIFERHEILDFEISEDGAIAYSTKTGSMVGRAAIGGALFGPLGAVVGGATAKKKSTETVNSLVLRVFVADPESPVVVIPFITMPTPKGSTQHNRARAEANHWKGILMAL